SGLAVYTSIDPKLQQISEAAFDVGLRRVDKRRGFRRPKHNVIVEGGQIDTFQDDRWKSPMQPRDVVPAVALPVAKGASGGALRLRAGTLTVEVPRAGYAWTRKTSPDFLRAGDVVQVRLSSVDASSGTATGELEQDPQIEGSLVAIDNATGQIKAMIGGF